MEIHYDVVYYLGKSRNAFSGFFHAFSLTRPQYVVVLECQESLFLSCKPMNSIARTYRRAQEQETDSLMEYRKTGSLAKTIVFQKIGGALEKSGAPFLPLEIPRKVVFT